MVHGCGYGTDQWHTPAHIDTTLYAATQGTDLLLDFAVILLFFLIVNFYGLFLNIP